jgi:hypothetical protein
MFATSGTPVSFGPSEHQGLHKVWGKVLHVLAEAICQHPLEVREIISAAERIRENLHLRAVEKRGHTGLAQMCG